MRFSRRSVATKPFCGRSTARTLPLQSGCFELACISDSLVLSLAMLFKSDPKAVNLRQLLNTLCRPEHM
jgi:hypothetical protein